MSVDLKTVEARFDALTLRERTLLGAAVLVVLAFIGWQFFISPALNQRTRMQQQLDSLVQERQTVEAQLVAVKAEAARDIDAELKAKLKQLVQKNSAVETQLLEVGKDLIPPEEMGAVLREMLVRTEGLRLVSLRNLPVEPLVSTPDNGEQDPTAQLNLFRHPIVIEFEGGYLATISYLKRLEHLERPLFWDDFELRVESYPRARIQLKVHTLSFGPGLVGV